MVGTEQTFTSRGEWIAYLRRNPDVVIVEGAPERDAAVSRLAATGDAVIAPTDAIPDALRQLYASMRRGERLLSAPPFLPGGADGAPPQGDGVKWTVLNTCREAGFRNPSMHFVDGVFVLCAEK
jgi:hypothetical protein